jgi:hypothetical protein
MIFMLTMLRNGTLAASWQGPQDGGWTAHDAEPCHALRVHAHGVTHALALSGSRGRGTRRRDRAIKDVFRSMSINFSYRTNVINQCSSVVHSLSSQQVAFRRKTTDILFESTLLGAPEKTLALHQFPARRHCQIHNRNNRKRRTMGPQRTDCRGDWPTEC